MRTLAACVRWLRPFSHQATRESIPPAALRSVHLSIGRTGLEIAISSYIMSCSRHSVAARSIYSLALDRRRDSRGHVRAQHPAHRIPLAANGKAINPVSRPAPPPFELSSKAKPRSNDYKMADGGGMYLLVKKSGYKYWRLDYRFRGKRKTLALGAYPQVGLCTSSDHMRPFSPFSKRHFSARRISSLTC